MMNFCVQFAAFLQVKKRFRLRFATASLGGFKHICSFTLKSVFGSDLCGLMVGRGQNLQVISPPQDFLTLTQTNRPARLRVGDSVRFLQDNRAPEVTVLSGHPRLRGRQILLACYAHLVSTLLFQIGKQKSLGGE